MDNGLPGEAEFWKSYYEHRELERDLKTKKLKADKINSASLRDLILKKRSEYNACLYSEHNLLQRINKGELEDSADDDLLDDMVRELKKVQKRKLFLEERYIKGDPIKLRNNFIEDLNSN